MVLYKLSDEDCYYFTNVYKRDVIIKSSAGIHRSYDRPIFIAFFRNLNLRINPVGFRGKAPICGLSPEAEKFLADRTNGRAYVTVLRLSSVCDVMYCG